MKRAAFIFGVLFLVLMVLACDFAGITVDLGGESSGNDKETVEEPPALQPQSAPVEAGIDAPPDVSVLQMGPVKIAYHASSVVGIAVVELSIDGVVVSSIASPDATTKVVALSYSWNPPAPGSYILQVRAQNKNGEWSNFAASAVTIQGAQPAAQLPQQAPPQQVPLATNTPEPTKTPEPTATPDKVTIYDVKFDKNKFYYGDASCGSREITISAKVARSEEVSGVYLFNRFFDNQGGGTSNWDSGHAMSKKSEGTYSITIASDKLANYNMYRYGVMNYQIVASGKTTDSTRLAVTEVFKDIQLNRCP